MGSLCSNKRSKLKKEFSVEIQYSYNGGCSMRAAAEVNHKDNMEQVWAEHYHSWGKDASFYKGTKGWQNCPGWAVVFLPERGDSYKEVVPRAVAGKDFKTVTLESLGVTPETFKGRNGEDSIKVMFFPPDVEKFDSSSGYHVSAVQKPK